MAENYLVTHLTLWLLIFSCNIDIQAKYTISGILPGLKILRISTPSLYTSSLEMMWTLFFCIFQANLEKKKLNKNWKPKQKRLVPLQPKCWTCLSEMLCQQLFTHKPIIFIGHGSQAGVDRLIYSNSESHLYSLYPKAQPSPYSNATLSRTGMLERERERERNSLEASRGCSGSCTKECSFGEIIFASICNLSRNGCNYFLPCLLERTYGKISLKNVTLGHGLLMGIMPQGFFLFLFLFSFFSSFQYIKVHWEKFPLVTCTDKQISEDIFHGVQDLFPFCSSLLSYLPSSHVFSFFPFYFLVFLNKS